MIGEKTRCGLDIGTRSTKASLLKARPNKRFELIAAYELPTRGLKRASVTDLGELTECIQHVLRNLSRKTQGKFKDLQLGISGHLLEPRHSYAVMPLVDKGNKVITSRDIRRANKQASLLGLKIEEEILHEFPQHYVVDGINMALNPVGLYGRKLAAYFLLIITQVNLVNNLIKAVHQAGYDVSQVSFSSFRAAEVSLTEKMANEGCLLIDIGAGSTDMLFFKDGVLRQLEVIPLGGDDITEGIHRVLHVPFDLAEEIKKSFAEAVSDASQEDKEILIKKDSAFVPIKREVIHKAIEPEVKKLITQINDTVKSSRLNDRLKEGIVMVGGGALLPGLIERIEQAANLPVKTGKIQLDITGLNKVTIFTSSVGLAKAGFEKSLNHVLSSGAQGDWFNRISGRIKEIYEEYF